VGSNREEHQRELFGLDDNETVVDSWNGFAYLGPLDGSASGAGKKAGRIGRRLGRLTPLVRVQASHAAHVQMAITSHDRLVVARQVDDDGEPLRVAHSGHGVRMQPCVSYDLADRPWLLTAEEAFADADLPKVGPDANAASHYRLVQLRAAASKPFLFWVAPEAVDGVRRWACCA
jgi:hypothetical protein